MLKLAIGFIIAITIGVACRYFKLPIPAPPTLYGVLLILAITLGYIAADKVFTNASEAKIELIEKK